MTPSLTKEQRSERMWDEHPIKLNRSERAALAASVREAQRKERRLRLLAYIDKARHVDAKKLREIADEIGVTFQRVQQLLAIIEQKPARKKRGRPRGRLTGNSREI